MRLLFTVSPTAIILSESEQLVVAIDLLPPVTLPSTTLCASLCVYVYELTFYSYTSRHLYSCLHVHFMHFTYLWMSIHIVCFECMSVWRSACFSFPENSPWGDSKSSQQKFLSFFFKPSSHSGRPSLLWASRGAPHMGRGFAGRGGGLEWDLAPFVRPGRG